MSDVAEADIEQWVYRDPDQALIEIDCCLKEPQPRGVLRNH